jgi:glycosyltransferase involved in cell wall biosynthesis
MMGGESADFANPESAIEGDTVTGMDPTVSCIVIFLNEQRFIQEAIDSVLTQTFSSWELLLIDDGSTDSSTGIARRCAAMYPERVRYLEHEGHQNRGMSASRNLGIRSARGKYIAFLDADDVWLPDKLERQVPILANSLEAAMVYGCTEYWFSWTGDPEARGRDFVPRSRTPADSIARPPALLTGLLAEGPPATTCSILLRREALESVGGFEESFRGLFEDQAFLAKVYLKESVFVSSACVARYRMHPKSHVFVEIEKGRYPAARLSFLDWLEDYLIKAEAREPEIWKALRGARWRYRHPVVCKISSNGRHLFRRLRPLAALAGRAAGKLTRAALGKSVGSIIAHPNPIRLSDPFAFRFPVGVTTLSWTSKGTDIVEVHVDAPDGPLLSRSGPTGSITTGQWVTDGMVFHLQDVSRGRPLMQSNTLDVVEVTVRQSRRDVAERSGMIRKQPRPSLKQSGVG